MLVPLTANMMQPCSNTDNHDQSVNKIPYDVVLVPLLQALHLSAPVLITLHWSGPSLVRARFLSTTTLLVSVTVTVHPAPLPAS
jgi:hypothetical protein